jgi:hypothetical protein
MIQARSAARDWMTDHGLQSAGSPLSSPMTEDPIDELPATATHSPPGVADRCDHALQLTYAFRDRDVLRRS